MKENFGKKMFKYNRSLTRIMSKIEFCDFIVLFGVFVDTNKHQYLTKPSGSLLELMQKPGHCCSLSQNIGNQLKRQQPIYGKPIRKMTNVLFCYYKLC